MTVDCLLFEGDFAALQQISASSPGGVIVNIGAFKGGSTLALALANPRVTVLSVDTFAGVPEDDLHGVELRDEFLRNVAGVPNVVCLRCDSVAAARMVCTPVEAVFVDGDHSYEGCRRDLVEWWPKVRSGGILCGHDCVESCGVPQALDEFCAERGLKAHVITDGCHGFFVVRKD